MDLKLQRVTIYPNYKITWKSITMPSRRNGQSSRRWYHRICLASSADTSDSSDSETYEPPPPVDIGEHHPSTLPAAATYVWELNPPPPSETYEPPPPVDIGEHHPSPLAAAATYDWQLHPPPPPPLFILDELPQRVRRIHVHVTCDHFFCSECIHGWINFNQNNSCPVCRRRLPAVPPPPSIWEYFFPPVPFYTESPPLVGVETESSPSPSMNNSEAGYDTACDELDASHAHPQDSLASTTTPTTVFPHYASGSTSS